MERNIREYFENETMPEDTVRRIEDSLRKPRPSTAPLLRMAAVFAVVLLAVGLFLSTDLMEVCADVFDIPIHTQKPEATEPLGQMETEIYVSYGGIVGGEGEKIDAYISLAPNTGIPAEVIDGRLYFTANAEHIDITDLCSEETAYVYALQDNTGVQHYFIIGGTPEDWGYQIFLKVPGMDICGGWICGGSAGATTRASDWKYRQWAHDGQAKVGHPWPLED
ncbi:MAG: hypothetical protein IKC09_06640 [Oscillospiraceae bacterium]|nr:hypothetical protein [Oscillospiraceae bacterium]MBR2889932.1 hypothetical protein [Oscillospiraceae bacterium]